MKKTSIITLLIIPIIVSLLLISYVSATSWFNNFDYYQDHNYKNLYDFLTSKKDSDDNRIDHNNQPEVKSEFYQVDLHTWLNQEYHEDNQIIVTNDNNQRANSNDDKNQVRYVQEPIVYTQPSVQVIQKKVINKREIKQMMCDRFKCYIEYQDVYQ